MNFKELCQLRYSVRSYKPDAIPSETMEYIKECARLAPSAVNRQPWQFFTITNEEDKQRLQQCYDRDWFKEAPAYILVCENAGEAWTRRYDNKNHADIDASIAIEHICLAAAEQGLGTCWVCNFRVQMCQELFQIPEHLYPVAIIPIGYPASAEVPEKTRKEMSEIWTEQK
ncbi:MAG: nitroreductase family protein [Paraprevotella sp.]|jgi:nitroreductase|nr:nitroreductase family protein [Paraprevotella sp.]MBR0361894.1 nitroreductase family protein [Paraprevotella sp.]